MKIVLVGLVAAACAIQSTLAVSLRHGHADMTPDTDPQSIIPGNSSDFLETLRQILSEDSQDPTGNHRSLQDGPNCGALEFPCTHGAVCKPDETKGGAGDWCFCDVANGYMNDPGPDIPMIALHGLQGYRSCVQAVECSQMSNVCAPGDEGGGCEDRDPENGKYMCFCKEGYLADTTSIGDHGPEACDQVNECLIFENICGNRKVCIDTPGSFQCLCEEGLIETQTGDCLNPPTTQNLTSCDPVSGDNCVEPERECDRNLKKCVCIPGWIQPAGPGGQCQREPQEDECTAQADVNCDRRGRGGPNPRSTCIDREPYDGDGNPRQGYTCECLPPFQDAPNAIRGSNCLEPDPTAAPVSVFIATPVPEPTSAEPTPPGPALPCTTFVCVAPFSFCAAKQNKCVCQSGYIQSLGSSFACEEKCFADTDCLPDEHCFESRCTACPAGAFREATSVAGCVCQSGYIQSLGSPFACEEMCSVDTECLTDEYCFESRCTACAAGAFREVASAEGCVTPVTNIPCDPTSGTPCEGGTLNHGIPDESDTSSDFVVSSNACVITDVDVFVNIEHPCTGDLDISFTHDDTGTTVILWGDDTSNKCSFPCLCADNFQITFDDNGGDVPLSNCGSDLSGTFKPIIQTSHSVCTNPSLSDFNGENAVGAWTLRIADEIEGDSGLLVSWSLIFACE